MGKPGRHAGKSDGDEQSDLKPLAKCQPAMWVDPRMRRIVREAAQESGVSELEAAYAAIEVLRTVLEVAGLTDQLPTDKS